MNVDGYVIFVLLVITGRNEVVAKVIFLHLFVILFTGGFCLSACWDTPLGADSPPEQTPLEQNLPPGSRPPQEQTPLGSRLQHMVYEWPVGILLECILV